ncbi:MAG: hypothetical protein ACE5G8_06555, partial [Anaerolineae bacterium]
AVESSATPVVPTADAAPSAAPALTPTLTPSPTPEATAPVEPGIPAVAAALDFGLPAGNGFQPRALALHQNRLYILNRGHAALDGGNTVSRFDVQAGRFSGLLKLKNYAPDSSAPFPEPLALVADPYRPRLYALWGDRYGEPAAKSLSIIDTGALTVTAVLTGVEAVYPAPDRLYLSGDSLRAVDPLSLQTLAARPVDPRQFSPRLALNRTANRLYLGRGRPWQLTIFAADTLEPVAAVDLAGEPQYIAVDEAAGAVLVAEKAEDGARVRLLAPDGDPLPGAEPAPLPIDTFGPLPLAVAGDSLYLAQRDYPDYLLNVYRRPGLTLQKTISLPCDANSVALDPARRTLYAVCSTPDSVLLAVDLSADAAQVHYTHLTVVSALPDPDANRLYILDNRGILRVQDLTGHTELARLQTDFNTLRPQVTGAGELALDPARRRLYIGGKPAHIINTQSLQVTARLDTPGQLTPDPTGDRLYLTPPCACRQTVCNTLILNAQTLTGTETLFPQQEPLVAPCVTATRLDADNQLLYARIYNGVPGSNSGDYYTIFDVSGSPRERFAAWNISFGEVALDPAHGRAFAPRYRINRGYIHRFEAQGQTVTQTLELVGAQGELAYDPAFNRLYVVQSIGRGLQVFDGDLTLLAEITLPGRFSLLAFDSANQRLYLANAGGTVLVVKTGGGQLEPPPPPDPETAGGPTRQEFAAPGGLYFRIWGGRLYRSADGGQTWQLLGAGLPGRPVGALGISPNFAADHTLLAGLWEFGWAGGMYRSTDGGDSWRPATRGLTDLEIAQIAFSPTFSRDRTIFANTFDRGLFRSTDGGDSWTSLGRTYAPSGADARADHLALSPTFADDGLVIISRNTLLRSTDGGNTWAGAGVPGGVIAFSPNFAADRLILNGAGWRSTDAGQTWQPAAAGRPSGLTVPDSLHLSPNFAADQTAYLLLNHSIDSHRTLHRSTDAGRTWESLLGGLPGDFNLSAASFLPDGRLNLVAADGRAMSVSPAGLTWGNLPPNMAALEVQDLAVAPGGALFAANNQAGVFKSTDGGRTWAETGFPARSGTEPARLAAANDGALFAAAGGALERSDDGGASWRYLPNLPAGFRVSALAASPNFAADGVVLAGGNYAHNAIIRSADRGQTWQTVFERNAVEGASDVAAIVFAPGAVYAWLQYGGLLHSGDGGLTWAAVELGEADRYFVQSLAVAPGGSPVIAGALDGRVLVWEPETGTVQERGRNIPEERSWSSTLAFDAAGTLFLGTDRGVYRSSDMGQTWAAAWAGLPLSSGKQTPGEVNALRAAGNRLYAAPARGGLFASDDGGQTWRSALTGRPESPLPETPAPTPAPTPTPEPPAPQTDGPAPPPFLADVWAGQINKLGCPVPDGGRAGVLMAGQSFEGGIMVWRSDTAVIYALPFDAPFAPFADDWDSSQPVYACPDQFLPQTPPTPQRGFGKVWCRQAEIRQLLGSATGIERPFEAVLQEFDHGLLFKTDRGEVYLLDQRANSWQQLD